MNKNTAIVALARKRLVVVWHVLTEHVTDHHADPEMVAFKLTLAPRLRAAQVQAWPGRGPSPTPNAAA